MAGFTERKTVGGTHQFHIGDPNLADRIREVNDHRRVIHLQLDGDELEAALWGLENYKKPSGEMQASNIFSDPQPQDAADGI